MLIQGQVNLILLGGFYLIAVGKEVTTDGRQEGLDVDVVR